MVQIYYKEYSKEKYEVKKDNDGSKYIVYKDNGKNVLSGTKDIIRDIIDDDKEYIAIIIKNTEREDDLIEWANSVDKDIHIEYFTPKRYVFPAGSLRPCGAVGIFGAKITHIPTGIVVICEEERSTHKNKQEALKMLKAYLIIKKEIKNGV